MNGRHGARSVEKMADARGDVSRALDRLRCPTGLNHDVRMEWETRGGLRTGDLVAYCWTCRKAVAEPTTPAPRDTYEYRQSKREKEREKERALTNSRCDCRMGALNREPNE